MLFPVAQLLQHERLEFIFIVVTCRQKNVVPHF